MFEGFSIRARRAVFLARREAQDLGSPQIKTVHLLLGILREDQTVAAAVGASALNTIRKELEQHAPPLGDRPFAPKDLQLSKQSQRALTLGIKEAGALRHETIDTPHLVLGLLRIEKCTAAKLLRAYGMEYARYREVVRGGPLNAPQPSPLEAASPLQVTSDALEQLVDQAAARLRQSYVGPQPREAVGHLIDWAMAHQ
jgi:ATP-dependent Clp protease ATP-binding subunit ClpC